MTLFASDTGPVLNGPPPGLGGSAMQGQTLTEAHANWLYGPTGYGYQWERCDPAGASCSAIGGETQPMYTLGGADVGHTLRVQEVASNPFGASVPATSSATGLVQSAVPANGSPPLISGLPVQGQPVTEAHGAWSNSPTGFSYQWWRCDLALTSCQEIPGATSAVYIPTRADVGSKLRVQEAASNQYGTGNAAMSAASAAVQPPLTDTASIIGPRRPPVGEPETYRAAVIDTAGRPSHYTWTVDGRADLRRKF